MKLHISVKPNGRKDEVIIEADGAIKVKIIAPPVEGKANKYLMAFLSVYFNLPKSSITLLNGETNSFKTIEIDAPDADILKKLIF
jgi:uncharacterized protein (TIGR00251 family)